VGHQLELVRQAVATGELAWRQDAGGQLGTQVVPVGSERSVTRVDSPLSKWVLGSRYQHARHLNRPDKATSFHTVQRHLAREQQLTMGEALETAGLSPLVSLVEILSYFYT